MTARLLAGVALALASLVAHAAGPIQLIPGEDVTTQVASSAPDAKPGAAPSAGQAEKAGSKKPRAGSGKTHGSDSALVPSGIKGYWFYLNPPKAPETHPPLKMPIVPVPGAPKPDKRCADMQTWTVKCGFVTPASFAMQARERDALLRNMVMNPGDPGAVRAVQEYTRWVVHQALYVTRVWKYNELQSPRELDPSAVSPISQIGLRLASGVRDTDRKMVWQAVRDQGGFLVVFTKDDCQYCHAQASALWNLSRDTHIPIWDASIGGECLPAFKGHCLTREQSLLPARILHVSIVPAVMLYLPGNVWIRVSNGLTTTDILETRLYNLFLSWKVAAVDAGKQTGNTGLALNPDAMPTGTDQLQRLLATPVSKQETSHGK